MSKEIASIAVNVDPGRGFSVYHNGVRWAGGHECMVQNDIELQVPLPVDTQAVEVRFTGDMSTLQLVEAVVASVS
jgi:hypothetical protein